MATMRPVRCLIVAALVVGRASARTLASVKPTKPLPVSGNPFRPHCIFSRFNNCFIIISRRRGLHIWGCQFGRGSARGRAGSGSWNVRLQLLQNPRGANPADKHGHRGQYDHALVPHLFQLYSPCARRCSAQDSKLAAILSRTASHTISTVLVHAARRLLPPQSVEARRR